MLDGLGEGLAHLLTWQGAVLILIGLALGTAAAILPGIAGTTLAALLLPLTFTMDKYQAFILLAALLGAGGFAGSITAILINVPGDSVNAATCLDGYPLARQGKAGVAIGASATSSALGSVFGMAVVVLSLPVVGALILAFGPPEFFALAVAGVALVGTVSTRSPLKGLVAGMAGMLLGFIGDNPIVGGTRYTFGILELFDGISLVPVLIGLFAIPELFDLMRTNQTIGQAQTVVRGVWQGVGEVLRRPVLLLQSCLLGTVTGLLPGVGQTLASWISYFIAAKTSREPETFGKGNIEGVIAPEATIDTKEAASLLPLFVFGLPAGVNTAILLSAFQIFGVVPGQQLLRNDMPLVWVMLLTIVACSLLTSALGFAFAGSMVKITLVPVAVLAPIIYILGLIGAFADQGALFGIGLALLFGLLGIVMQRLDFPRAPVLVGLVLVPFAERNFAQALQLSRGSYLFLTRPITLTVLVIVALAILFPLLRRAWRRTRQPREQAAVAESLAHVLGDEPHRTRPLEELLFALVLLGVTAIFIGQTFDYAPAARRFPLIVETGMVIALVYLIVRSGLALSRQSRRPEQEVEPGAAAEARRAALLSLVWLLVFPILTWLIGMVAAVGIYTVAFVAAFTPRELSVGRGVTAVATAAGMVALVYYVFERWLGLRLYQGILG